MNREISEFAFLEYFGDCSNNHDEVLIMKFIFGISEDAFGSRMRVSWVKDVLV